MGGSSKNRGFPIHQNNPNQFIRVQSMPAFNLNSLSETTPLIKTLKTGLQKAIGEAITSTVFQKVKRVAGESTRDVDLKLENGQKITVIIRQSGDVVRVKVNDKDFPMSGDLDPDYKPTFNESLKEIAQKIKTGQSAFETRRKREKVNIPRKPSQSILQQITDKQTEENTLDQQQREADDRKAHLEQQLAQLKGEAA